MKLSNENTVYPACFDINNKVVVGAIDQHKNKMKDSNYSNKIVDIMASGFHSDLNNSLLE